MKVEIKSVNCKQDEKVVLECISMTPEFEDIKNYCLGKGQYLLGTIQPNQQQRVYYKNILYVEAIGEKVFAYTYDKIFEIKNRLYEIEKELLPYKFKRCSKSFLICLLKVDSIRPALNGRYCARMDNGEDIIVSRKYAQSIKEFILEEL